jgi:SAM-dependent methyltransferase
VTDPKALATLDILHESTMMALEHGLGESDVGVDESRLAYQPDIYQRYSFLRGLTGGLLRAQGPVSVLDVGCGPVQLTEAFLGPGFQVVRADVERFDGSDIDVIVSGQNLPFATAAFDLAVAIEVLEHVPAKERPSFVRELQRVSRQATIICCPVETPETIVAERRFSDWAVAISGRDVDFLLEHREFGLPDGGEVVSWFASPKDVLVADNAPLADWLAFNLLDFIYAADFADTRDKERFDAAINERSPLHRAGAPHYRRFFCAIRDPAAAEAAQRFVRESTSAASDAPALISEVMSAVVDLRDAIRSRFGVDLAAKDASIAHLTSHIAGLDRAVDSLQVRLTEHDSQLASKDAVIAQLRSEVDRGERLVASLQARLDDKEAQLDEAHDRLRSILSTRSWRATAPARALGRSVRRASEMARRFARRSRNS